MVPVLARQLRLSLGLALVALAAAGLGGCGGRPPRVWNVASSSLTAEVDRVVYVDLDRLAKTAVGRRLLKHVAKGQDVSCQIDRGEILWVVDRGGNEAVFARVPEADAHTFERCTQEVKAQPFRPPVMVIGRPQSVAKLVNGDGALIRDDAFATGLLNVDFDAPLWMIVRSKKADMPGVMTVNVRVAGEIIELEMRVPVGSRVKAWWGARLLTREMNQKPDKFATFSAGADGTDVVINASVRDAALETAMDDFLR
jgi:hypothetical protein